MERQPIVLFCLNHIFKNDKPDYIFSGINAGTNIGDEFHIQVL